MGLIVVISEGASPSDFLARTRAEGMLVKKFGSIPRIFEILDREIDDFSPAQYPEIVSIEPSNKQLKGCFTQTLNFGTRWTGANWALARHVSRKLPWSKNGTRLPLSSSINVYRDGTGVDIYIVDTGIEVAHPEFDGRATMIYEFTSTGGIGDDNGHGTACAGCAAGSTRGYARGAQLFGAKVLDNSNTGTAINIIAGIDAVIAHYNGRAATNRPAVMSISVIGNSNSYSAAIDAATAVGIVVVAAAGNDASNLDSTVDVFPAENNNVIAVGAVGPGDSPSSFTNFGTRIDLLAGGSFIDTAQLRSINPSGYTTWNGTSFASPMVAGAIACVLQDYQRLTTRSQTQLIRNYMKDQATWDQYDKIQAYEPNTPAILYLEPTDQYPIIPELSLSAASPPVVRSAKINITANNGGGFVSGQEVNLFSGSTNVLRKAAASSGSATASTTEGGWLPATPFELRTRQRGWITSTGNPTGWLKWIATDTIDVVSVCMTARIGGLSQMARNFQIQYSDDDTIWTSVLTVTDATAWSDFEVRGWVWDSVGAHKYWRINITLNNGDASRCGLDTFMLGCSNGEAISTNRYNSIITAPSFDTFGTADKLADDAGTGSFEGWTSDSGTVKTINIFLPIPHLINRLQWQARPGEGNRAPRDFNITASTAYGEQQTTIFAVNGSPLWESAEIRSFEILPPQPIAHITEGGVARRTENGIDRLTEGNN